jgi:hypothetical protein
MAETQEIAELQLDVASTLQLVVRFSAADRLPVIESQWREFTLSN